MTLYRAGSLPFCVYNAPITVAESANVQSVRLWFGLILWSKTINSQKGPSRTRNFYRVLRQGADRHARGGLREAGAPCLRHINLPVLPPRACGHRVPDAHDRFSRQALAHALAHALGSGSRHCPSERKMGVNAVSRGQSCVRCMLRASGRGRIRQRAVGGPCTMPSVIHAAGGMPLLHRATRGDDAARRTR